MSGRATQAPDDGAGRPEPTVDLSGAELLRWYWLREELAGLARLLGVSTAGGKELLARRVAAALDGVPFAEPDRSRRGGDAQLGGSLSPATPIPPGQRCSQVLRNWMVEQVGPAFRFDGAMRAFVAGVDGSQTLQDAVAHWHASRSAAPTTIDPQFEYNRFTRAWHEEHPGGSRTELLAAWREYRRRPVDRRERA